MKTNLLKSALVGALTLTALASSYASAHAQWLVPSHTSLSGDKAHYVMIDASISNEIFSADKAYRPKQKGAEYDDNLIMALDPSGGLVSDRIRAYYLQRKNSAAVKLADEGTYHIAMKHRKWYLYPLYVFGPKNSKEIPVGAKDIRTMKSFSTVDTFVSRNGTSKPALLGSGLEISGPTHPNDLFVGEEARFQLLKDGKPAANVELAILKGDTRYRNERNEVKVTTDKQGFFTNTWQHPGLYLIEASVSEDSTEKGIDTVRYALFTTLDVAPE